MTSVQVRRSGGLLGLTATGSVDLTSDDDRAREAAAVVAELGRVTPPGGLPQADRFVYTFWLPGREEFSVPEQLLTPALHRLVELALDESV